MKVCLAFRVAINAVRICTRTTDSVQAGQICYSRTTRQYGQHNSEYGCQSATKNHRVGFLHTTVGSENKQTCLCVHRDDPSLPLMVRLWPSFAHNVSLSDAEIDGMWEHYSGPLSSDLPGDNQNLPPLRHNAPSQLLTHVPLVGFLA